MISWKSRLHAVNKKMPVVLFFFSNFQVQSKCASSAWKAYLLCIYFQYFVPGFSFWSEWSRASEVYQRWWAKWGSLIYYSELVQSMCQSAHKCIWIFCFGSHEDYLSLNDVQVILRGVTQNPKYLKAPKIEPFSNRSQLYLSLRKVTLKR